MKRLLGRRITPLSLLAACLVAASLAGPSIRVGTKARFRALVFDNSASFRPDREKLRRFVEAYTEDLAARDRWCLWAFGKEPVLIIAPRPAGGRPEGLPPLPVPDTGSCVLKALRAAASTSGHPDEIVILSDGRETAERNGSAGPDVSVPVYPVVMDLPDPRDARVSTASGPAAVAPGERFAIEASVRCSTVCDVVIDVLRGGVTSDSRVVSVDEGGYDFRFEDSLEETGLHHYVITVKTQRDAFPENDSWRLPVRVGESRPVLVVSPFGEGSAFFTLMKRAAGFSVEACAPRVLARDVDRAPYCCVILEGLKAAEISPRIAGDISFWVRDGGGGLLVATAGPGRDGSDLAGTDLGGLLPVDFNVGRGKKHLIVALDRSGSMAQKAGTSVKVDMARKAALAAAGFVGSDGLFDVLSFDTGVSKTYSAVNGVDLDILGRRLAAVKAAGGTDIVPALDMASGIFGEEQAGVRMLIVISDGFAVGRDWSQAVNSLKSAAVAVSVVGIGNEVNEDLLSRLASQTRARWIHLRDASEMPAVVAEEARSGMCTTFVTGSFSPGPASGHPAAGGVGTAPGVSGRTRCRPKEDAQVVIHAGGNNPLLTVWRISSGKCAFLAVPLVEKYAGQWLAWPGLQALVEATVRWCAREDGKESAPAAASAAYPAEFRNIGIDRAFLAQTASSTGGKVLGMGQLPDAGARGRTRCPLAPYLVGLAVACLFADIVLLRVRKSSRTRSQGRGSDVLPPFVKGD